MLLGVAAVQRINSVAFDKAGMAAKKPALLGERLECY